MLKRLLSMLIMLLSVIAALAAASVTGGIPIREDLFWSEEELGKVDFDAPLDDEEREYYENTHIYIVTASPAEPVYIFFGHAGIVVDAPDMDEIMFDYGSFRFNDEFYANFVFGRLYYSVIETYAAFRYQDFMAADRTIEKLELDLTPEEKKAVIGFLSYNALPENETYLYHYYKDNCATRPRDIYNAATGGEFKEWADSIDTGKGFRAWSTPYMSPSPFFALLLNYLQGPSIDVPITLYDACFLPDVLISAIAEFEGREPEVVYQTLTREETPERYCLSLRAVPVAIAGAAVIMLTASRKKGIRIIGDLISAFIWLFLGILSLVLAFVMTATIHDVSYGNWNFLLISPLVLGLSIMHLSSLGRKERRQGLGRLSRILLITAIAMLTMKGCLMDLMIQDNIPYYIIAISLYGAETAVSALCASRKAPSSHRRYAQDR